MRGERWKPPRRSAELPADPRGHIFRREGSLLVTSGETGANWAARRGVPEHKLSDRAGHGAGVRGTGREDVEERNSGVPWLMAVSSAWTGLAGFPVGSSGSAAFPVKPLNLTPGQVGMPP